MREFGHLGVCTADFSVNSHRRLLLHGVGDVAVDVQGGLRADVAYNQILYFSLHVLNAIYSTWQRTAKAFAYRDNTSIYVLVISTQWNKDSVPDT